MKPWYLYIVECRDGTFYTGITTDIKKRIDAHNSGRGAKYTRGRGPVKLMHLRRYMDRSAASKAEYKIKKLKRGKKIRIINEFALPGEIVIASGRSTIKKSLYALVVSVRDYSFSKYTNTDSVMYDFSDGTSGFSYGYTKIKD
jgi:putative endonuclease